MKRKLILILIIFLSATCYTFSQEICDNGLDDDSDGFIDLNDPDCKCLGIKDSLFIPSSLIPNPSFEDFVCCPSGLAQLNCSKNWIQASRATSDYYHTCGFRSDPMRGNPPQPLPAGNGYVGFLDLKDRPGTNTTYKEYVGACINQALSPNKDYTLSFWVGFGTAGNTWGPRSITTLALFGTPDCNNLPFGLPNGELCPTAYPNWYEIKRITASGVNKWTKVKFNFRPTRKYEAIAIGPQCAAADGNYYFFIDDLVLEESAKFDSINFSINGNPCSDSIELLAAAAIVNTITYQWYKNGIAIPGATTQKYLIPKGEEGMYTIRAFDGKNCELSNTFNYNQDTFYTTINANICEGEFYTVGSSKLLASGNYNFRLKSWQGCDSLVGLNLTVNKKHQLIIDTTLCEGSILNFNDTTFSVAGSYNLFLKNINNCDSVITINLNFAKQFFSSKNYILCEDDSILIDQTYYNNAAEFELKKLSIGGCDSIIRIKIIEIKDSYDTINFRLCQGDTLDIKNNKFTKAGLYSFLYQNEFGCDSNITISILEYPTSSSKIKATICEDESFIIGNQQFNQSGLYKATLSNTNNCDSLIELELTVNKTSTTIIDTSICKGNTILIGSSNYSQEGKYKQRFTNFLNCDSILEINLKTYPNYNVNIDSNICDGKAINIHNSLIDKAGIYQFKFTSYHGCDSNFTVKVNSGNSTTKVIDTSFCEGDYIIFNNQRITSTGQQIYLSKTHLNCDSTIILNTSTKKTYKHKIDTSICFNDTLTIDNIKYFSSGKYIQTLNTYDQCDSILEIQIQVYPEINITSQIKNISCYGDADGSIILKQNDPNDINYQYQWSNNSTNQNQTNLSRGSYNVTVSDKIGCTLIKSYSIDEPKKLELNFEKENANCRNHDSGYVIINLVQGGTPPLHLTLNNKSINNFQNKIFLEDGIHQIQIIDDNNCLLLKNFEITKSKRGSIDIPQDTIYLTVGDSFEVKLNIKDIDRIDTIDWNGNSKFSCKNCEDPFITPLKDQIKIQVKLIDSNGCEYIDFVIFRLKQKVTVPNVFSPNGDGLNDFFTLISDSSVEKINSLKIFDRWGELIFESKDAIPNSSIGAWDGTFRNEPINPGVYVYLISYQNKIGDIFTIAGDITLLK